MTNMSVKGGAIPFEERRARSTAAPVPNYLDQNELREAFRKVWRRKRLIFGTAIFLTTLMMVAIFQIPPRYTGEVSIMVDPRNTKVVDVTAILEEAQRDTEAINSEVEVLTSRQLAGRLVDKLRLIENPEFNKALKPKGILQILNPANLIPDEWMNSLFPAPVRTPEETKEAERNRVIVSTLDRVRVLPKPRTRVVSLNFQSEDPRLAAQGANALADLYIVDQLEQKFEATQRVTNWLNERIEDLRKKVEISDHAVEAYRAKQGLLGSKGITLVEQQISELTTQLTVARADRSTAEAKLHQVEDAEKSHGSLDTILEVLQSPTIQSLRQEQTAVEKNIADLAAQYGERHPKLISARAQAEDLRKRTDIEIRKVIASLQGSATMARSREAAVSQELENLKKQVAFSNSAEVELRQLETEANANHSTLETFLGRFKETNGQDSGGIQTADSRIISRADVPELPSFPKKGLFFSLALIVSTLVGVILAFVTEHLDRGFRSGVQFEQLTGTPVLSMIPQIEEGKGSPPDYLVERPLSAYSESLRTIHTSMLLSNDAKEIKTVVVSSAQPGEGKSTLALSLTRLLAISGLKVILVEADLRRPSIHTKLGVNRSKGLAEVLIGSHKLEDLIYSDPKSTADILLAGEETVNPSKLVSSHQMQDLINQLSISYDMIIIDTAPVLAVSDGLLMANIADGTIYCCRWAVTHRETSALGLKELKEANARIIGAVISLVDMKKSRGYGYADTSYYTAAKKYYGE